MTFKLVLTTANSIIGVSILAMPYCYQQCGIILTTVMIMCSALLVRMCCHLLVRGAYLSRSRTYELLALHSYGAPGKFAIEFCMIGFLLGTCVAFFVVIGDLMPPFAADILGIPDQPEVKERLRLWVMTGIGIFCALPLSLLRSLDSLSYIATASIAFYTGVTVYIGLTSSENLSAGEWVNQVNWWRPAGIFHTLPILCMALSCQPQVFEVRQALVEITRQPLGEASVSKMNKITSRAVNLCASVYTIVGISGYIALYNGDLGGNVLTAYTATLSIKIIKIGFGLSVALSFPLVIFPCRTAIHSLIFRKTGYSAPLDMPTTANYIPSTRSNAITLGVILVTLIIGINTPDIEKVLGMVGSTIGNCVCILMPAAFFLKITQNEKDTTERLGAKVRKINI